MNVVDLILIAALVLVFALVVWKIISNKRKGKGTCSCGTGACGGCPVKNKDLKATPHN